MGQFYGLIFSDLAADDRSNRFSNFLKISAVFGCVNNITFLTYLKVNYRQRMKGIDFSTLATKFEFCMLFRDL